LDQVHGSRSGDHRGWRNLARWRHGLLQPAAHPIVRPHRQPQPLSREDIMMRKSSIAAAAVCLAALTGCKGFLDSEKGVADPNAPTVATRNQLFVGVLANTFGNEEGPVAMIICEWMQQCGGVNGRFVDTQGTYQIDASTFDIPFQNIFNGGGLIGLRSI